MDEQVNIDWFSFWAHTTPHATAITISDSETSYTYGEINAYAIKLAAGLEQQHGIKKGDRLGIISKNCIEYIYLFAAAQKLGVILVPFNYRLTEHELSNLIQDADPKLLFVSEEYQIKNSIIEQILLSSLHQITGDSTQLQSSKPAYEDPIFILYTSGSSGVPKGVLYTHKMLFWNSCNTSVSLGVNNNTSALVSMPPFHTGGWNVLLTPVLHHGGHAVITEKFDAKETLHLLAQHNCDQYMAVPTMLKMISELPNFNEINLPKLQYIIVGGEAMPLELIQTYEYRGIAIRQGYGMTEAGPNLTSLHHDHSTSKLGSIGKPNMYVKVILIDDDGSPVPHGQHGEMCIAGPMVMPGYWQRKNEIFYIDQEAWFKTGDIAKMDNEGFLYIHDRKKNMFISGGENVYPKEIEKVLSTHPHIEEAIVIGVPHEKWGEVGKAFIVAKGLLSEEEILNHCRKFLSKYKLPHHIIMLSELPLNAAGKVDRVKLK